MFALGRKTQEAQEKLGNWSTPAQAGGAAPLGEAMYADWLKMKRFKPETIPATEKEKWIKWLQALAAPFGGDIAQACTAVRIVLHPKGEFGFKTHTSPAVEGFKRDWAEVMVRLLNGSDGRKPDAPLDTESGVPVRGMAAMEEVMRQIEMEANHG